MSRCEWVDLTKRLGSLILASVLIICLSIILNTFLGGDSYTLSFVLTLLIPLNMILGFMWDDIYDSLFKNAGESNE